MTASISQIKQLVDNVEADAQGWIEYMDSLTWVGGIGKRNPFYGKHHSPETIKKIRKAREHQVGKYNPFWDHEHSEEAKGKNREAHLGNPPNSGSFLLTVVTQEEHVLAALDDNSFQICWNKMLSETGISSSIMEPLKAPTEKDVLAGNLTYGGGGSDYLKGLASTFKQNIYNCMTGTK